MCGYGCGMAMGLDVVMVVCLLLAFLNWANGQEAEFGGPRGLARQRGANTKC